jgi:hypothetical protein
MTIRRVDRFYITYSHLLSILAGTDQTQTSVPCQRDLLPLLRRSISHTRPPPIKWGLMDGHSTNPSCHMHRCLLHALRPCEPDSCTRTQATQMRCSPGFRGIRRSASTWSSICLCTRDRRLKGTQGLHYITNGPRSQNR